MVVTNHMRLAGDAVGGPGEKLRRASWGSGGLCEFHSKTVNSLSFHGAFACTASVYIFMKITNM
jgi:hypothetical protein